MEHPVYDINGTAVEITGNPNEDYLLIPDNLKNMEDAIISVITAENVSTAQIPHYITNQDYMIHITNAEQQILFEQALESSGLSDFVMQVYSLSNDFFHEVKKISFCLTIRIIIISWLIALGMFIFIQKQLSITVIESALVAVIIEIFKINVVANRTKS